MEYLLKAAFAFFDILMLIIFVVIGMFNLFNGYPDRSLVFELFYLEIPFSFAIFMGHRTKRILRIERKEYQTY